MADRIKRLNTADPAQGGLFVTDEYYSEVNKMLRDGACVSSFAKHFPMKSLVMNVNKFLTGVDAYFVDAMARKPKDKPTFEKKIITAEKIAVIVPFEDELLEDADVDIAALVEDDTGKAFIELFDRAAMGYEPTSPYGASLSANTPAAATIPFGSGVDLAADVSEAISAIEVAGFDGPTGMIANPAIKHLLRNLRDADNNPIYTQNLDSCTPRDRYCLWGIPICFTRQAPLWGSPEGYEILMAYGPYVFVGDRTGMRVTVSHEATLTQDNMDDINLFEDDMSALRFVMRKGFQIKQNDALAKVTGVTI